MRCKNLYVLKQKIQFLYTLYYAALTFLIADLTSTFVVSDSLTKIFYFVRRQALNCQKYEHKVTYLQTHNTRGYTPYKGNLLPLYPLYREDVLYTHVYGMRQNNIIVRQLFNRFSQDDKLSRSRRIDLRRMGRRNLARVRVRRLGTDRGGLARGGAQNLLIRLSVQFVGAGVDERIYHRGRPSEHGRHHVQYRDLHLVVDHVHQHQRHEAHQEAEKYSEHQPGHPGVLSALKAAPSPLRRVSLEILSAPPHAPVYAEVRDTDHNARYDEAQNEQKFLRAGAVFIQDGARERGRI